MNLRQVVDTVQNPQMRRSLVGMLDSNTPSVVRWALRNGWVDTNQNVCPDCGTVHDDWRRG